MGIFKTIGIVGSVAGILISSNIAFAQERPRVTSEEVNVRVETNRVEAKARMEAQREEVKERMETQREEAKARMETAREETKTRIEAKREEAKQRVADIKDKVKQQKAERLSDQFDKLNERWTNHFTQLLDRYSAVLLKIQERADIAAINGKDVTAINSSILSANTAIETARAAVVAQAIKSYTPDAPAVSADVTTSSGQNELLKSFREAFQDAHKKLFNDLFALRDGAMKNARVAVQTALQTLSQIPDVDDDGDDDDDEDSEDN